MVEMLECRETTKPRQRQAAWIEGSKFGKIAFVASDKAEALAARHRLVREYGEVDPQDADAIVALGGDGLLLRTLLRHLNGGPPVYGMNLGSVGFLMNAYHETDLIGRLERAAVCTIHPLRMIAYDCRGTRHELYAINEMSLFRQSHQAGKLRITVDGKMRLDELVCDGALVATPIGSTAYNLSVNGPVLPINAPLLALTPISVFRPRRWRGAVLPNSARIKIDVLEADKRPMRAVGNHREIENALEVSISEAHEIDLRLMYDPPWPLGERILSEQFSY